MNKRIFSIALAIVLAMACMTCAFATPSIQSDAVVNATVVTVVSSTGATLAADFAVKPVEEPSATTAAVITDVEEAALTGGLTTYFGANTMADVASMYVGVTVSNLKLDEAFPISVANYAEAYGDVTVTLRMTKDYEDGDVVVALIGIVNADGTITWMPVEATVVDGEVSVVFTQEILKAGATSELVFALLSE